MKTKLAVLALACVALTGCTGMGTARVLKAAGDNTNSLRIVVTSIYGNITVERNIPAASVPYKLTLTP